MATAIILLTDLLRGEVMKHSPCIHGDIGQVRRAAILASVDNNESLTSRQISYCVKDTAVIGIRFTYHVRIQKSKLKGLCHQFAVLILRSQKRCLLMETRNNGPVLFKTTLLVH